MLVFVYLNVCVCELNVNILTFATRHADDLLSHDRVDGGRHFWFVRGGIVQSSVERDSFRFEDK